MSANSEKQVATTGEQQVAVAPQQNYIVELLQKNHQEFVEANEGMELDYVRVGEWLKLNKKGKYVESADDAVSYGDVMDVVIGKGEQRYILWGKDGSPEKGELIVAEKTREEGEAALAAWLSEKPEAAERYFPDDIALRYLAYLVPVNTLQPDADGDVFPKVYIFDFPKGDTIGWGKYAKALWDGKYKALGIKQKTTVNRVVTRFESEERKTNDGDSYLGTKFYPVGIFNPADYGIKE